MGIYLQPQDDGLSMRKSGRWVAEKLDYLRRYIDIFTTSMHSKPWRAMHYIDLFAGPGKCYVPELGAVYLGSPLLALTAEHPFTEYLLVDLDAENIAALEQRARTSPFSGRVRTYVGDSNVVVRSIVEHILDVDRTRIPDRWHSLNLAFLDPAGLELRWSTVAALSRARRMDMVIHYPQGGLSRCMPQLFQKDEQTVVDLFFGGTEWRAIYAEYLATRAGSGVHRPLMSLYSDKLAKLGYKEVLRDDQVGYAPLMRNAQRKAPLYRLLFASKHPLGRDFWRKVTQRDVHGQTRLF